MKTTVKFKLRASQRVPGSGVLVLQVTRRRVARTMKTPYVLSFDEWNESKQSIVFLENISSLRKKELVSIKGKLRKNQQELRKIVETLEVRGNYSSQELLNCFRERQQGRMFCAYVLGKAEMLRNNGRFGTAHTYQYAAVSFLKFLNGNDVRIEKINAVLMEEYERYLLLKNKGKNTVSCYMRTLRAAYNQAGREKVFVVKKAKENPFTNVFTGNAKTRKRAISGESISRLLKVEEVKRSYKKLGEGKGREKTSINSLACCRDLFLFSFYTQGMSFTDMAGLKKENIKDGVIRYKRKKTGQLINIELEDCMKKIIERYTDSSSKFIFPILKDRRCHYEDSVVQGTKQSIDMWKKTANALVIYNKNLKKLAALAGINEHLTSYVARHSWATIASQEGIPIATISRGMGHESEKTTRIYISQIDYSDVGRANRQILSKIYSTSA